MIKDMKFITMYCKFGATVQMKFLEGKYLFYPIYSRDFYAIIQKFQPTKKLLSNNVAKVSDQLDLQKEKDSRQIVAKGQNSDNILTYLFWITSAQVKNWIKYSDCVLNDVTHKINRYDMALLLFVRFNNNHHNILLAQALLVDESFESHKWILLQIIEATNIQPSIILTDADSAIDTAISQVFQSTYYIHCAFYITQNLHKNLRKILGEDY